MLPQCFFLSRSKGMQRPRCTRESPLCNENVTPFVTKNSRASVCARVVLKWLC